MAKAYGTHFVVTANSTDDGRPLYLTAERTWTEDVAAAAAIETEAERDELIGLAQGQQREVCDPYAFKVELQGGAPSPTSAREKIRATGPTTPIRRPDRPTAVGP